MNFYATPRLSPNQLFPKIGSRDEMSPINDVTYDYENDTPPVLEVRPHQDEPRANQINPTPTDK
jgi:hypothetical protein